MKQQSIKKIRTEEEKEKFRQIYFKVSLTIFLVALFFVAFVLENGFLYFHDVGYVSAFSGYDFQFHVINVGQGDCFLIKLPDSKVMLVDCGESVQFDKVKGYINDFFKSEKLNKIDYFVLSHQDNDHLGSASEILNTFKVEKVFRPKVYSNYEKENGLALLPYNICETKDFNNFTLALYQNDVEQVFNRKGILLEGDNYRIEFLSPSENNYEYSNDYSAVIMLSVYDKKFLLTGDASTVIESELISKYGNKLKADVLKIAHHGSKTSSSAIFLEKVKPTYAILSVGKNNSSLPNVEILNRLHDLETEIYSTKKLGCYALSIENKDIVMQSQPSASKSLPLIASLVILAICFVWGINFKKKVSI